MVLYRLITRDEGVLLIFSNLSSYDSQCLFKDIYIYIDLSNCSLSNSFLGAGMVYLLPLFTVFIWGGNAIVNKMAASTIEPSAMSFYRWLVAIVLLTPFCLPNVIKHWQTIRPYLAKLAFLAMLGMVLNQSLSYYAGLTTTASNMALITSLVPLLAIFLSVPLLAKPISPLSIVGGVLALAGLMFMLGRGDIDNPAKFALHEMVLNEIGSYVFIKNRKGEYLYANQLTLDLFDTSLENLKNKTDADFFHPDLLTEYIAQRQHGV